MIKLSEVLINMDKFDEAVRVARKAHETDKSSDEVSVFLCEWL